MPRPKKVKEIYNIPNITYFKPAGVPLTKLKNVVITIDELECLRFSNIDNLSQIESANKMKIHQSTFQRTLAKANKKITEALVLGKAIKIEGGKFKMPIRDGKGPMGYNNNQSNEGRGMRNHTKIFNENGLCKCPSCGYTKQHYRGTPCNTIKCPKCNALMTKKIKKEEKIIIEKMENNKTKKQNG